jgi:oxygen-dependent protoporphyrinogen oxidase
VIYRYIFVNGKLNALPSSPMAVITSPIARRILVDLAKEFFNKTKPESDDESIGSFISRRLSPRFASDVAAPMIIGIYGGNISKLSVKSCFNVLWDLEQKYGGIFRGLMKANQPEEKESFSAEEIKALNMMRDVRQKGGIFSFKQGLGKLPDALAEEYQKDILFNTAPTSLKFDPSRKSATIMTNGKEPIQADHIISTIPSFELAKLMQPHNEELSKVLNEIPWINMAVINFGYNARVLPKNIQGFGYLVAPKEKAKILGVIFDSDTFSAHQQDPNQTRLTVMIGGDRDNHENVPDVSHMSNEELTNIGREYLQQQLNIQQAPDFTSVKICENAIPQYTVGHSKRVDQIEQILSREFPHLHIAGSSYNGVSVVDCISSGKKAALKIL